MKYVLLETYKGSKKILQIGSSYNFKKYGLITITPNLSYNTWYDLSYNIYKIDRLSQHETSSTINPKTIHKYQTKKDIKNIQKFRILPITPLIFHKNLKHKYYKTINYISMPVIAYLQLFFNDALIFDNAKGLAIFCALYRNAKISIFRANRNHTISVLRFFEHKNLDINIVETDVKDMCFGNVIVVGKWDFKELFERYNHFIGNNILVHVPTKEEAVMIWKMLENDGSFIDICISDFFFREWTIQDNIRPEMDCSMENGFVVQAIKININKDIGL